MRVGICCIAKDEDPYIEEWVEYHQKLGVDEIFVYENNWKAPDSLQEKFGVHCISFDGDVMQIKAYNRCLHLDSIPFQLDWLAFVDCDEFIVNRGKRSFKEELAAYDEFPALGLNWRLFGSGGLHYDGDNRVLERFTKCGRILNKHVKALLHVSLLKEKGILDKIFIVNPHTANLPAMNQEGHMCQGPFNEENLGRKHNLELAHFFTKTPEEFREKCARGRADTADKRKFEDDFGRHDMNEIEDTTARDFYRR